MKRKRSETDKNTNKKQCVPFSVVQIGLGPMGAIDIDPEIVGKSLKEVLQNDKGKDVIVETDFEKCVKKNSPDVVFISTASSLIKVAPLIKIGLNNGSNVVSICEELSFPFNKHSKLCEELDKLAKSKNLTVVGTGINPGYLMDLLPIVMTAPCQSVKSVKVTRMMNSGKRRVPFQKKIGTGLTVEEFRKKIDQKKITGHVGLCESMGMILSALGWEFDEMKELPPEPVLAEKDFVTSYGEKVRKGDCCGLKSKSYAKKDGVELVSLDFTAYAGDHDEYDKVDLDSVPPIQSKIVGGCHGDFGTSGMAVNLIPKAYKAKAGLLTMKDIEVACCTESIFKCSD